MKIEFRRVTRAGNNVHAEMYFNGVLVAPGLNCTPEEFSRFTFLLIRLNEEDEIIIYEPVSGSSKT